MRERKEITRERERERERGVGVREEIDSIEMHVYIYIVPFSQTLSLIRPGGGGIMVPPPSTIFLIVRERIWMAPRRSLTFFFRVLRIFKKKKIIIGPTVTRSRDLLSLHVSPKIAHFCDLCTKHMEMSFFLKIDQTLVIGSYLKFRWLLWESK